MGVMSSLGKKGVGILEREERERRERGTGGKKIA